MKRIRFKGFTLNEIDRIPELKVGININTNNDDM